MNRRLAVFIVAAISLPFIAFGASPANPDPHGVLRKPIPDKLVVLTFDDGCASHATVVAPILKKYGFGGSFYVCDFDSFWTRKDWYLTWRQMRDLNFKGEIKVGKLTLGGVVQPAGTYNSANVSKFIKGTGILKNSGFFLLTGSAVSSSWPLGFFSVL